MEPADQQGLLPRHVAIIMDGNGRWACQKGLPRLAGHRQGADTVRTVVRACREQGIEALTLYAFSTQNWGRPSGEVDGLMHLLAEYASNERDEILENNIRFQCIGDLDRLPAFVRDVLTALASDSRDNGGMLLSLALSYGGREDIVQATRAVAQDVAAGRLSPEDVNEELLAGALWSAALPPDVDLLIRTGGEWRVSNFLLWDIAYAEIVFTDVPWPAFTAEDLAQAFTTFASRERRFGMVTDGGSDLC